MKRRDFFKGILGATTAVAISPLILPGLLSRPKEILSIPKETGNILVSDAKGTMAWTSPAETIPTLTDSLFKYLDSHKDDLKFKYKRTMTPAVSAVYLDRRTDGIFAMPSSMCVMSRKLRARYTPELANDLHCCHVNMQQELEDAVNGYIVHELNNAYPDDMLYIYQLVPTPVTYNPEDFTPRRGLILRLAVADKGKEWVW